LALFYNDIGAKTFDFGSDFGSDIVVFGYDIEVSSKNLDIRYDVEVFNYDIGSDIGGFLLYFGLTSARISNSLLFVPSGAPPSD
jgi:hypothetical protein